MRFEDVIKTKIDLSKVKLDIIKPWINKRITVLLGTNFFPCLFSRIDHFNFKFLFSGVEDDVVIEFIFNQLEAKDVDPKRMQINLTGFLNGKNARIFMGELWTMLDSAQNNAEGIPQQLLDEKKEEMKKREVGTQPMVYQRPNPVN